MVMPGDNSEKQDAASFYDAVAGEYNNKLSSDASNGEVRKKVADYFLSAVKGKNVMDFGGGTGLDLAWLAENNYTVSFCEPSKAMRSIAVAYKSDKVDFLIDNLSNFEVWQPDTFYNQFDGVLANFAVVNSIANLQLLFEKMALVVKPGGHIVANMLDTTNAGIIKHYLKNFVTALLSNGQAVLTTSYQDKRHIAYLHTPAQLSQAASPYFICKKVERLHGFGFMLIHWERKA